MKKSTGKKGTGASNKNTKGSKSKSQKGSAETENKDYIPEDIDKCMAAWWRSEDGSGKKWSKRALATKHHIPEANLRRWIKCGVTCAADLLTSGPSTYLNVDSEDLMGEWALDSENWCASMEIEEFCVKATELMKLQKKSPTSASGIPGRNWVRGYLARWKERHPDKELHLCRPWFEDRKRARATQEENLKR